MENNNTNKMFVQKYLLCFNGASALRYENEVHVDDKNGKDGDGKVVFLSDFKKTGDAMHPDDDVVTHSVTIDFTKAAWANFNRISKEAEMGMGVVPGDKEMDPLALLLSGLRLYQKMCETLAEGNTFAVVRRKKRWAVLDRLFGAKYEVLGTFMRVEGE